MKAPERILLTTDFSEHASLAYPYAVGLARRYGAVLVVANIVTAPAPSGDVDQANAALPDLNAEALAKQRLQTLALEHAGGLRLRRLAPRHGSAAPGIVSVAGTEAIDLVVLSSRGRRPIAQLILGSVARAVVAAAPCPVLCVREGMNGLLERSTGEITVRRILVPTDLSERSRAAVQYALAWARAEEAAVHILHVVQFDVPPVYFAGGISSIFQLDVEMRDRVLGRVSAFVDTFDASGVPVTVEVDEGVTARQVARYALEHEIDVIVMTRRGYGDTPHLLGGVCERLLHDAPCPLLVVGS